MIRKQTCDVVIAGGGMIGLTLGIALARAGVETVVMEASDPSALRVDSFDGRVSSLAPASRRMLEALSVWEGLECHAEPVLDIIVGDGTVQSGASSAMLHFDHRDIGTAPLAHMVENRHFRRALEGSVKNLAALHVIAPARVTSLEAASRSITVQADDGSAVVARLCVAADGRGSRVRELCGITTRGWSYAQAGIVATVDHDLPHRGVARQLFLEGGPFAILPMKGNRSSIVWSEKEDLARLVMALPAEAFASEVLRRFGDHLGPSQLAGPRWSYPLSLCLADSYVQDRVALVGDAAHAVHPLAGQGLNLGLRDVAAIAQSIVEARRLGLDPGMPDNLQNYAAWRRVDNAISALAMDALHRMFSNDSSILRGLRRIGLDLVDSVGPLKSMFMRQASGESLNMPRLLRGEPL